MLSFIGWSTFATLLSMENGLSLVALHRTFLQPRLTRVLVHPWAPLLHDLIARWPTQKQETPWKWTRWFYLSVNRRKTLKFTSLRYASLLISCQLILLPVHLPAVLLLVVCVHLLWAAVLMSPAHTDLVTELLACLLSKGCFVTCLELHCSDDHVEDITSFL